ncbi:MAG: protein-disulfide isomerase [Nitrosopumilaceae archaeon]|uniref:Protein-disulfide isomerase n=2 Tax=Candidatus Nitrosomaritimum aestuariumsis TaxID=3342354 RepID=A0AC60VYU9_9ARCH|nr:protein-disulfide isomerase [Nitrosopumilaceae archaeon]MBA4460106.1 protein-disulfide isomerase [Nitrosopumilaceae archaeon]MBA4462125.1 protein-disulfide isomerase [Nitrosopumilaceae archaeon]MBA4463167.1 protein-disulfide isomerase [Nitrosopumilaceae archaeon]
MGRKERREREQKRESYASQRSSEKRRNNLIAVGVFAVIAVIVGYAAYIFATDLPSAPGGPENAGALGSEHSHAGILVKIFGDTFDFSAPAYQIKSSWIHFEGNDGTTVHKHATGVTLGYLFESLGLGLDDQCYEFQDGRSFCTNEDYSLKFFINGEQVNDIRDYEINEDDKILVSYGAETQEEIEKELLELEAMMLVK